MWPSAHSIRATLRVLSIVLLSLKLLIIIFVHISLNSGANFKLNQIFKKLNCGALELLKYFVQFLIYLTEMELGQLEVANWMFSILHFRIIKEGLASTKILL